ncbi:uncharacterized protein PGTG_01987 [Puccinia graminis f. sp. tritici CRL 75-36-700-3]|uniref:Uncharacterized protein n=1 Tax=Puccinia graminis f. sp. tritici (strain CRL 75-36-700-3 / race SCCL) TaxID=418459 RepID=E3JTL9_PUCGT|nr:uncharacterized protein PGTG_01987 [Puccinia graminis f. sp. tritici CRL 75-36-700-3]EFP75394.2 hypothetical protein PGTG_01987 [Puccinia graminis f. sp. tritici CRL 75-36-700-3]
MYITTPSTSNPRTISIGSIRSNPNKEKGLGLEDYQEQLDRLSLSIQTQLGSTRNSQQPQQQHKNTPQHRCRPPPVHPRRSHPLRFQSPAHSPLNSSTVDHAASTRLQRTRSQTSYAIHHQLD